MPHVGGGSHGGGFHSSSSGTHSTAPRYDNHGNLHSTYYVRPGFYIDHLFIPFEAKKRKSSLFLPFVFLMLFGVILGLVDVFLCTSKGRYDSSSLEEYALHNYSLVYEKDANYENNILVNIVAYEDNNQLDYISIVGDNVDVRVDNAFGNHETIFGAQVKEHVGYTNYFENLYSTLAICVNNIIDQMPENCMQGNTQVSKIINNSKLGDINGENELITAEQAFFNKTGYHISFYIGNNMDAYPLEVVGIVFVSIFTVAIFAGSIYEIIRRSKLLKTLNKAIEDNTAEQYFEGEDDYATHLKNYPYGLK